MAVIRGELINPEADQWLQDTGQTYIQVRLCDSEEVVKNQWNQGKTQPILLKNVVSKGSGKGWPNAIICDRGSVIKFIIKSKGPRGFGYTVRSSFEPIADALYYCDRSDNPGQNQQILGLPYYWTAKKQGNAIKVDDWETLGVAQNKELREQYWQCKIITWPIYGFKTTDGRVYGSPRGSQAEADVKGAGVYSGDDIKEAPSQVSEIYQPANPEGENNGFCTMYFFVFSDRLAKENFYESYMGGTGGSGEFV